MFKTTIAAAAAAIALAPAAALAGPYVNVETNAGWVGDDYTAATTDLHVGFEGEAGTASYYVQAGPAIVAVEHSFATMAVLPRCAAASDEEHAAAQEKALKGIEVDGGTVRFGGKR